MVNKLLITSLCNIVKDVKSNMEYVGISVGRLDEYLPREKELKEQSRVMFDSKGEVFLYYDGVYYSWEIVVSILRKQEVITIRSLYDAEIN